MGRPLRIEFPGAIYHVMTRGNARRRIFREEGDYQRLCDGLEKTVDRFGFEIFSFVWMPNHIHLFFRTPESNLSRGMQYLLSGYANWFSVRRQRPGHLFQGRFKGELIEDESYFWMVSRYLHLNPVRGKRPLVEHPWDWRWSSYPGYDWRRQRIDWGAYDLVYETTPKAFCRRRSAAPGRDVAAWLARRLTSAMLRELAEPFGLGHPDSVSNLVRRANEANGKSKRLRQDVKAIRKHLAKTENRV